MSSSNYEGHNFPRRTGFAWTASAHMITAVIGSGGVVSLSWAMSQLGWIAGPILLLILSFITNYTTLILAAASPLHQLGVRGGTRNYTYMDVVRANLGDGYQIMLCGAYQYLNLYEGIIGYTIFSSRSMTSIDPFFQSRGVDCPTKIYIIIVFGVVEMILSQIPELHQIWWTSIVSSIGSLIYSTICFALGIAKVAENREIGGSLTGISVGTVTGKQKILRSFQALGSIICSFSQSLFVIEIQENSITTPVLQSQRMKRAIRLSLSVTTTMYMLCACVGYAAFGDSAPYNLLISGFDNHYYLVDVANAAIVIHYIGAYQVNSHLIFAFIEKTAKQRFPNSTFINGNTLFRVVWRCIFVALTTLVSVLLLPYFNGLSRGLGAVGLWRLSVYNPIKFKILQDEINVWSLRWIILQTMSVFCLVVSVAASVGTVAWLGGEFVELLKGRS